MHFSNWLNTLFLKFLVQIDNIGALGCKYMLNILIINVRFEYFSLFP